MLENESMSLINEGSIFKDKLSSFTGTQPSDEEIQKLKLSADREQEDDLAEQQAEQLLRDQQEHDRIMTNTSPLFAEENVSLSNMVSDEVTDNKEYRYKQAKQAIHDYAKMSSAEQAVVDARNREKAIQMDGTILTPEEARELGNQYGVDLKYDKNVTKGEALFSISRNIYKRDIESQLAEYGSEGDFSAIQNIGMASSAISGGVGFYETAATVALGFLLPEVGIATLAKVGKAAKSTSDITKGIDLAYKTRRATALTNRYKNTLEMIKATKDVSGAYKSNESLMLFSKTVKGTNRAARLNKEVTTALEGASRTTQFWNNAANLALGNKTAVDALSMGTKMGWAATDAIMSSVPSMAMSGYNSSKNQTETYTAKDCAIESLFAGTLGLAFPVLGKGIGKAYKIGSSAFNDLATNIIEKADKAKVESIVRGIDTTAISEEATKTVEALHKVTQNMKQPSPNIVREASAFSNIHMTSQEFMMNFSYMAKKLLNGEIPRLTDLPNKSLVMTHLASGLIEDLKKGFTELSEETISKIKAVADSSYKFFDSVSFEGETGMLGRSGVVGLPREAARKALIDIYRAIMFGDADAYVRAAQSFGSLRGIASDLGNIIQGIHDLRSINFSKDLQHKTISAQRDFREELKAALGKMKFGDDYDRAVKIKQSAEEYRITDGRIPDEVKNALKEIDAMEKELDEFVDTFGSYKTLDDGTSVFNPDTKKLNDLIDDLNRAADNNQDLLDTDDFLKARYGSPEELIDDINSYRAGNDTDMDLLFGMPRTTSEELDVKMKDVKTQQDLVDSIKGNLESRKHGAEGEETVYEKVAKALSWIEKRSIKKGVSDTIRRSNFSVMVERLGNIEEFLSTGMGDLKANLQKIFDDPDLQKILANTPKGMVSDGKKSYLRGNKSVIRRLVNQHVSEPLLKVGVILDDKEVSALVERFIDNLESGEASKLKEDTISAQSKLLGAIKEGDTKVAPEQPQIIKKGSSPELATQRAQDAFVRVEKINEMLDPLMAEIQRLVLNREYNDLRSVSLTLDIAQQMIDNPYVASEVLVSKFTFSPYNLEGSNLNIENLVRNSGAYIKDIETALAAKETGTTKTEKLLNQGHSLVEYFNNPANKKDILTAMVALDRFGSADAAKKAGIPINNDAAIVAQEIRDRYATLLSSLADVGSMKTKIGNRLDTSKLRNADTVIPEKEVEDVRNVIEAGDLLNFKKYEVNPNSLQKYKEGNKTVTSKDYNINVSSNLTSMQNSMMKLFNSGNEGRDRIAMFAFKHFDLDKMFNKKGTYVYSMNEIRDAILSGDVISIANKDLRDFDQAARSLESAINGIVGTRTEGKKVGISSWIDTFIDKVSSFQREADGTYSKYISDMDDIIEFKNADSELKALDYLGFDTIRDQLEHDFDTGQRAYGVLRVAGAEPMKLVEDCIDFWEGYRMANSKGIFSDKKLFEASSMSEQAKRSIRNNALLACGLDTTPARATTRFAKAIADFLSAPLLVNAGFRSLTDYSYQSQWAITNGLAESKKLMGWTNGVKSLAMLMQDPELRRLIGYNNFIQQDSVVKMITNTDTETLGSMAGKTKGIDKLEQMAKGWSNFMINTVGQVGRLTNVNRSSAALTMMRSIASQAENSFENLGTAETRERLHNLLKRHGIGKDDWEFLRTNCVGEFKDYVERTTGIGDSKIDRDFKLFIPENLREVSDDIYRKEMERRGIDPTSDVLLRRFKDEMMERASILINSSADEMTTLPTYRTQTMMSLGHNKNSGIAAALGIILKYRSFGMACSQIHFGRRVAQAVDTKDVNNCVRIIDMILPNKGNAAKWYNYTFKGIGGLIMATAAAQYFISEAMDYARGQHQAWKTPNGKINWTKAVDPIIDSTGALDALLDSTLGKMAQGNFTTSGLQLQVAPAFSSGWRDTTSLMKPLFADAPAGEKAKRFAAASANVLAKNVGISTSAYTSLLWNQMIGSWLAEEERGASAYRRYINGKRRQGYATDTWYSKFQTSPEAPWDRFD